MPKKTKYRQWLEDVAGLRDWNVNDMINDPTYDYEYFYNQQPAEAYAMLNKNSDAHFTDIAKTAHHPTFSNESDFSGKFDLRRNPNGIVGGTWSKEPSLGKRASRYTLSNSQLNNNWNIDDTLNYIMMAEDNGANIRLPNGYPLKFNDGSIFGGVLPTVNIKPKKKK